MSSDETTRASFKEVIRDWMVPIDNHLAEIGVPIPDRVQLAADEFVEFCILDIEGDTKEDYLIRPWFRLVYRTIHRWYKERYGAAIKRPEAQYVGACEIRGAIFEIRVPKHLIRSNEPDETTWMVFPVDLQDGEHPKAWLVRPPNLEKFEPQVRQEAIEEISQVGRHLRATGNHLMTAEKPDPIAQSLGDDLLSHLAASAERLTQSNQSANGLACWEAHQAVEKALKLLGRQHHGIHQKTHDLEILYNHVSDSIDGVDASVLRTMPSAQRVIEMRAGESSPVNPPEAYRMYRAALRLCEQCTAAMPRKIVAKNAAFHLRKPPWM